MQYQFYCYSFYSFMTHFGADEDADVAETVWWSLLAMLF